MLPLRKVLWYIFINIPKIFSAQSEQGCFSFFYITEYLLSQFYVNLQPRICNIIYLQYYLPNITDNTSPGKKLLTCRIGMNTAKSTANSSYQSEIRIATFMSWKGNSFHIYNTITCMTVGDFTSLYLPIPC